MVRAPCCEKMGLKKGPWTPEEDKILVDYIKAYGHSNWRALPKQAGLLRCGKSCRLRWINYLRPDIKRGNFTREEEDSIIQLHQMLGNRWSAIAAVLPGRTDNEIKNVWHTHLKKRLKQSRDNEVTDTERQPFKASKLDTDAKKERDPADEMTNHMTETESQDSRRPVSPSQSSWSNDITSSNITKSQLDDGSENENNYSSENAHDSSSSITMHVESPRYFPQVDESFWSEVLSSDTPDNPIDADVGNDFRGVDNVDDLQWHFPFSPLLARDTSDVDFWLAVFTRATLPEM